MRDRSAPLLLGSLLWVLVTSAEAADLGRLFFTPQQRQDLDHRRQANIQESTVTVNSSLTINGQVSRSQGKSTVWINGVPQDGSARQPVDPTRVAVPLGEGESSVSVKIGQTVDKVRRRISDPVEDGKILVSPERRKAGP